MIRILHTADWQIGLKASHVARVGEAVRQARFEAARAVVARANQEKVDALVLAGDIFEDNHVDNGLVHEVVRILAGAQVPVFVLPGNHDPLSQDSVYRRASWRERPAQVRLLETTEPVAIAGGRALLLPAPLALKKSAEDPTLALRVPEAGSGGVLVGVAHGSLRIEGKHGRDDFPIALEAAARAGLGYLALGHWHGRYVHGERTAYSGTLETTKFGEDNSGLALLVSLDEESGARAPRIEEFRSGRLTWLTRELDAGALELGIQELKRELAAAVLPEGGRQVLLRLRTTGHSDTEAHLRLRELEEELAARYLHVELERRDLATHLVQGRVAELVAEHPFLGGLFDSLAEGTTEPELQGLGAAERDAARRLLAELLIEADEGAHA